MLGTKRQLSEGSVEDDAPPLQRRRSSITQINTERHQENDSYELYSHDQQPQIQISRYYDPTSNAAPVSSGPVDWSNVGTLAAFNAPRASSNDVLRMGQTVGNPDAATRTYASTSGVILGPPIQGQPSSVNTSGSERNHDQGLDYHHQILRNNRSYDRSSTNAPILGNPTYGSNVWGLAALDGPVDSSNEGLMVAQTGGNSEASGLTNTTWTPEAMLGLPFQRYHSSVTQASHGHNEDHNGYVYRRHSQRGQLIEQSTVYDQSYTRGPIFNGVINGNVRNDLHISTLDSLQFLYQHAAMGAMHESDERFPPPLCHPGTRDVVIGRVIGWYLDRTGVKKGIMWVHAPAGYGKTAVAGTVKEKLDTMDLGFASPVGATFFFWRSALERNSPARFIITLACQLAQSIPELRPSVEDAIRSKPNVVKMALEGQLMELIVKPFQSLPNLDTMPSRLVIVDGIDECINSDRESRMERKYAEDQEVVQIRVLDLIHRLHSHHLPLSFLILSRPEAWIKRHLESPRFREVVEPLNLYEVGDHMNDVKRFVRAELSRIAESFGLEGADEEWTEEQALVRKSEGHMVYAATAIRHIDDEYGDPRQLLRDIVYTSSTTSPEIPHSTAFSSLHELYRQIMRSCPERNQTVMMEVLGDIISEPGFEDDAIEAALDVLDRISGRSPGSGVKALRPLHAVLRVGSGNEDKLIQQLFIHSSFREFLQSPHLSLEFAVDTSKRQEQLLSRMLDSMTCITTDTIGRELEECVIFALNNWCRYWGAGKDTFLKSETTCLDMMTKILALDLTACIIETYHNPDHSLMDWETSPLYPISEPPTPSQFFVDSMELDGCADALSMAHKVTSHMQSALDGAFTLLLQATTLPAFSQNAIHYMAYNCYNYMLEVATQPNWREHKLVQALGNLGPNGIDLIKVGISDVDWLYVGSDDEMKQRRTRDLMRHIYKVMVHEKNLILESEVNPFHRISWLCEPNSESDSRSDP